MFHGMNFRYMSAVASMVMSGYGLDCYGVSPREEKFIAPNKPEPLFDHAKYLIEKARLKKERRLLKKA